MRLLLWWLAAALAAEAGVVRGVVVEHASGLLLARTRVRLQPVPNAAGGLRTLQVTAGVSGQFVFTRVPDGLYLLIGMRDGYFPAAHGQRHPGGQGAPIQVTAESDLFTELRLRRNGAITGRILDENGVGIAGMPVLAYRARLPLRSAGRAESDDRGIYRIHGLASGKYWVRTAAWTLDDGSGRLPTFGSEAREVREARLHEVRLDADTPEADVRPEPGTLFRLSGLAACLSGPVSVILSSETGRRSTQTVCGGQYLFEGLAPAVYEVFASVPGGGEVGFIELFLDRDNDSGTVQLVPPAQVEFEVRRAGSDRPANIAVTLMGRRQDLSESEKEHAIEMPKTTLVPGHWEMNALVAPDQYVESIIGRGQPRRSWRVERNPDWHDVFVEIRMPARVRITVSDKAGHIEGSVIREDKGVPGAPVFLWPVAESARRSLNGSRQMLSDTEGRFRFDGLPPGEYRVLATFDFSEMDLEAFNEARAPTVRVEASQTTRTDLPLWIAP